MRRILATLCGIGLALIGAPAWAQDLSAYGTPDLLQAAKREGKLVFYFANFIETEQQIVARFNKRFPDIRVEMVRAPGGQMINRIQTEAAANKLSADVIDLSDRAQARVMIDLFAPYAPPNAGAYGAETRTGDRLWPRTANAWTIAYNPALVADPPKSWYDLTKPEYAKLQIGQTIAMSGGAPWGRVMFERKVLGDDYWAKQAATKPRLFPSQAPMVDAMIRGEIALAPLVTNLAVPYEQQGAPVKWLFAPEGVPLTIFAAGVVKTAVNPNAARVFMNWALSPEGQTALVETGGFSSMKGAPMPSGIDAASLKIWIPDEKEYESLRQPWTEEWNKTYGYRQ